MSAHTFFFRCILVALLLTTIPGCCPFFQCYHRECPETLEPLFDQGPKTDKRPRLILVLGAGGVRGMAHVGVLEELEKAEIPIDMIIGCSAGAIIGSLYADCPDAHYVKSVITPMHKDDVLDVSMWTMQYGLATGGRLKRFLLRHLGTKNFDEMCIPFAVAATDLVTGDLVVLREGPVAPAVHASSAYPFFFAPVLAYDCVLVDGGVCNPIPVCVAQEYDPQIIIAVDVNFALAKEFPTNLFGVAKRCAEIKFCLQNETCAMGADLIIRPATAGVGTFDDHCNHLMYNAGREAARAAIPEIKKLLSRKTVNVTEVPS